MSRFSDNKKSADGIRRRTPEKAVRRESTSPLKPKAPRPSQRITEKDVEREEIIIEGANQAAAPSELIFGGSEEMRELYSLPGKSRKLIFWGFVGGLLALLSGVALLTFSFARVTIVVHPQVESVSLDNVAMAFDVSVSRTMSKQKVVPAELLELSRRAEGEFDSSGKELIAEKARGKVLIYNRFSSAPQTLVGSTRFVTDSGVLFRLAKTIAVPGAKIEEGKIIPESVEAELVADKAGEAFNTTEEKTLNVPGFKGTAKYEGFYAVARSGFSGGFSGEARVVSKDDLKGAEEKITKQVFDELKQEVPRKIPAGFILIDDLRQIQIVKVVSPKERSRSDRFSVEAEAKARVLVFRQEDVETLLRDFVVGERQDIELIKNSLDIRYRVNSVDYIKGRAEVLIGGNAKTKTKIPESEIAQAVKGLKEGSVVEALKSRKELRSFSVSFFPPWLFSAPADTGKIRVVIEE